jgi:hypothetical protein
MLIANAIILSPQFGLNFRQTFKRFELDGMARFMKNPGLRIGGIVAPHLLKKFLKNLLDATTLCCYLVVRHFK